MATGCQKKTKPTFILIPSLKIVNSFYMYQMSNLDQVVFLFYFVGGKWNNNTYWCCIIGFYVILEVSLFLYLFFLFVNLGFLFFFFFCIRLILQRFFITKHRLYTPILFHSVFFLLSVYFIGVTGFCGVSFFFFSFCFYFNFRFLYFWIGDSIFW